MALLSLEGGLWVPSPPPFDVNSVSWASVPLGDAVTTENQYVDYIFRAPRTGTLNAIGWFAGANSASYDRSLRVGWGNSAGPQGHIGVIGVPTPNAWNLSPPVLSSGAYKSVVRGEVCFARFSQTGGTTGRTCSFNYLACNSSASHPVMARFPNPGNAVTTVPGVPIFAIQYTDGGFSPLGPLGTGNPWIAWAALALGTTTPNERGQQFRLPFRAQLGGFWSVGAFPDGGNTWAILYKQGVEVTRDAINPTGTSPLRLFVAPGMRVYTHLFATPQTIEPNTDYQLTLQSVSLDIQLVHVQYADPAYMHTVDNGGNMTACYNASGTLTPISAWHAMMGFLLTQIDVGGSEAVITQFNRGFN